MGDNTQTPDDSDHRAAAGPTMPELLRAAREQLAELTGLRPETVSRFERTEDGWVLEAEVLELARVPETMSLMALYEVTLDSEGVLTGYRRVSRYERARGRPQT
ncbi:gas vesicle protein [Streptomyces sp. MST-110588]|uniref:gas vesicle protein GvpO n=1 Tax=Streptomyces sp. MST-110588 TaxID=2833628 RepID=UPI001F5C1E82|nr:gas vesicle protein [Streptomyces sp. MST-110588]UNO42872.1 gas vesicle protein [Streptomyces sp. MST-110588]